MSDCGSRSEPSALQRHAPKTALVLASLWTGARERALLIFLVLVFSISVFSFDHFFLGSYAVTAVVSVHQDSTPGLPGISALGMQAPSTAGGLAKGGGLVDRYFPHLNSHTFFLFAARTLATETSPDLVATYRSLSRPRGWLSGLLHLRPTNVSPEEGRNELVARRLRGGTRISREGLSRIQVTYSAKNPEIAVLLTNFIAQTIIRTMIESESLELGGSQDVIRLELANAESRLKDIDESIVDYRLKSKLLLVDGTIAEMTNRALTLKSSLRQQDLQVEANRKKIEKLTKEFKEQENLLLARKSIDARELDSVDDVRVRIQALRTKKSHLLAQGFGADTGPMLELDREIEEQANRLAELMALTGEQKGEVKFRPYSKGVIGRVHKLKDEIHSLTEQRGMLEREAEKAMEPIYGIPKAQQVLRGFERKTQLELGVIQDLRRRLFELQLHVAALRQKIRLLEKATLAGVSERWNFFPKIAFALLAGILSATGLLLLLDRSDNRLKDEKQLAQLGLSSLGKIRTLPVPQFGHSPPIEDTAAHETCRFAATRLLTQGRAGFDPSRCVVAICHVRPDDYDPNVARLLASAFAQLGKKTTLLTPHVPSGLGKGNRAEAEWLPLDSIGAPLSDWLIQGGLGQLLSGREVVVIDTPELISALPALAMTRANVQCLVVPRLQKTLRQEVIHLGERFSVLSPLIPVAALSVERQTHRITPSRTSPPFLGWLNGLLSTISSKLARTS